MSYLFNDLVGFKGSAIDAFNRLKVSQPFTLFDSQHRYQENDKWSTVAATGGTHYHVVNESVINMTIGTTAGSKVYRETKRVFPYQPGKSLLILNTFAMNQPHENLRQRVGYFGEKNGVYLEHDGLTAYMTIRSNVTGTVDSTTRRIPQSQWNGDTFDGNGACGRTLSVTAANIFWTDIEWLGVGDVRTGFFVDGRPVVAHTFHNDNINPTTYMTTAVLPIRYEIESIATGITGVGVTGATMKQICSSVMSEGGYEGFSRRANISTDGVPIIDLPTTSLRPIVSIRLNQNRLDSVVVPSNLDALITTSNQAAGSRAIEYRVLVNSGLSGGSWITHPNGNVDYMIYNPSSITQLTATGTDIVGGFFDESGALSINSINSFNFQLGRTQTSITGATGTSDTVTVAMRAFEASTNVSVDLSWFDII